MITFCGQSIHSCRTDVNANTPTPSKYKNICQGDDIVYVLANKMNRRRSCQAFGCSPIKKVRELGSDRSSAKIIFASEQFEPSEESFELML